jgi:hypothetical protein
MRMMRAVQSMEMARVMMRTMASTAIGAASTDPCRIDWVVLMMQGQREKGRRRRTPRLRRRRQRRLSLRQTQRLNR